MRLPLANGKYHKVASRIANTLAFLALITWLYSFVIYYRYDASRPTRSDTASGRTYLQNEHGHVVYLTREEDRGITEIRALTLFFFLVGFTVHALFVENPFRLKAPWEKKQW
jgi:hypothetical protein